MFSKIEQTYFVRRCDEHIYFIAEDLYLQGYFSLILFLDLFDFYCQHSAELKS